MLQATLAAGAAPRHLPVCGAQSVCLSASGELAPLAGSQARAPGLAHTLLLPLDRLPKQMVDAVGQTGLLFTSGRFQAKRGA